MRSLKHSVVRLAETEDTCALVDKFKGGNTESGYGLTYSEKNAFKYLYDYINHKECDVLISEEGLAQGYALKGGEITGCVMIAESLEFHDRPFCYIGKFWIFSSGRRTDASRELISHSLKWAKERDCSHLFVTATAELADKEQQLFINLMKKSGLVEHGPVLSLKME